MDDLAKQALSVSDLTLLIKQTLEQGFYGLKVTGEISNFRPSSTGHWFFTLKDEKAAISAVMFKSATWKVDFSPAEGDKVTVTGSLDVYATRGTYQIKCDTMEKSGLGEILALLEQRKRLYAEKGYFDELHKKPIPKTPKRVGIVTSPTGAALQDILNILQRRAPSLDVLILPTVVQGSNASDSIAKRIEQANALMLCDVLIVGRGGGSLEDLLPFSEDPVIQAIWESEIPVVSAVGHEIDWALSDYVADVRVPTPSAAAELVSQGYLDTQKQVTSLRTEMQKTMQYRFTLAKGTLERFSLVQMANRMQTILGTKEYLVANASQNMINTENQRFLEAASRLKLAQRELQALSPLAILARGYAVIQTQTGMLVKSADQIQAGDLVDLTFIDGKHQAQIQE